jgi:hypothetical protein
MTKRLSALIESRDSPVCALMRANVAAHAGWQTLKPAGKLERNVDRIAARALALCQLRFAFRIW